MGENAHVAALVLGYLFHAQKRKRHLDLLVFPAIPKNGTSQPGDWAGLRSGASPGL
jgi:hypothetical protein